VLELDRKPLRNSCPLRVGTSALLGDFSFTGLIGLLAASTTGRKEIFLSVAENFRDLARAVELRIILARTYRRAGQAIVFSCVVGV
jgi:hypothetical protein